MEMYYRLVIAALIVVVVGCFLSYWFRAEPTDKHLIYFKQEHQPTKWLKYSWICYG
jgi:hypothetical protein